MKKLLVVSTAALTLSACATTDIARTANAIKAARVTSKVVGGAADLVKKDAPVTNANAVPVRLTNAKAINAKAMSVPMVKADGKTKVMGYQPKIALVGYNVGAYTTASVTGKASGDLLGYSQGSRTTVNFTSSGITPDLVQRVATAAHDDLVNKLQKAGFDVVPASAVKATPSASNLKFAEPSYTATINIGHGKKTVLVAGPKGVGTQKHLGIGKRSLGGNGIIKPSKELSAITVMPNLVLDFAAVQASRGRLTSKSSASGTVRFAIDTASQMNIQASKGRFLDGWLNYGIKAPVVSSADFATMSKSADRKNKFEQGLGLALGMATAAKKTTDMSVAIDPVRYEALAMNAAAGWNDAFVAQMIKAKAK